MTNSEIILFRNAVIMFMQVDKTGRRLLRALSFLLHISRSERGCPEERHNTRYKRYKESRNSASQGGPDTRSFVPEPEKGRATIR